MDDFMNDMDPEANAKEDVIARQEPETSEAREALVASWCESVREAKSHWADAFSRMLNDQDFTHGRQWSKDPEDDRYVANIALRHVQQKTAALYAKNPKAIARPKERLLNTVWDGTETQLNMVKAGLAQAQEQATLEGNPEVYLQAAQMATPILQDAAAVQQQKAMDRRVAKTLELLFQYNVDEQVHPFKTMLKMLVRRGLICGASYLRLGFQRVMQMDPEVEAQIADYSGQLALLEQLSADLADGEIEENSAEIERMRLLTQSLLDKEEVIVREGLTFDFPLSTSIIPDRKCVGLKEFLGCDWVAQEYMLTSDEIKQIYQIDIGQGYTAYVDSQSRHSSIGDVATEILAEKAGAATGSDRSKDEKTVALVWEVYNKRDGLVYVICDGYKDFLKEPSEPEIYMERFWPWFPLVFNETEHISEIFPVSDVSLLRDAQEEINRSREGLREHRHAARPKTIVAGGMLDKADKEKLQSHPANAVLEIKALQPQQKVEDLLQPYTGPQVNMAMYAVEPFYNDVLYVSGMQEASLGTTSGVTATESNHAAASQATSLGSAVDDLDDFLTGVARAAGSILLLEVSAETVKRIIGPGAAWPEMSRSEAAQEIILEVEAGSSGRPNQSQEIQNFERLAPLLMQMPNINPEWLAKEAVKRLDDKIDITLAFVPDTPSISAMNGMKAPQGQSGVGQGDQGAQNAEKPPQATETQGAPREEQVEAQVNSGIM